MKNAYSFIIFLFVSTASFSQTAQNMPNEMIQIDTPDSPEFISVSRLIGYWYNNSAVSSFNAIQSKNKPRYVFLRQGGLFQIEDAWTKDYTNSFRNTRWSVQNNKLFIFQPEVGYLPVTFSRKSDNLTFDMTVHGIIYSRKIDLTGVAAKTD